MKNKLIKSLKKGCFFLSSFISESGGAVNRNWAGPPEPTYQGLASCCLSLPETFLVVT